MTLPPDASVVLRSHRSRSHAPARCPWRCPPTGLSCPLSSWWLGAEPHGLLAGSSLSPSPADGPEAPKKGASRRSPCPGTSAVAVPPPDGSGWGPGCGLQAGAGAQSASMLPGGGPSQPPDLFPAAAFEWHHRVQSSRGQAGHSPQENPVGTRPCHSLECGTTSPTVLSVETLAKIQDSKETLILNQ